VAQGVPRFAASVKKVIRLCGASIGSTTSPALAQAITSGQSAGGLSSRSGLYAMTCAAASMGRAHWRPCQL
jgi:hypothetical protein